MKRPLQCILLVAFAATGMARAATPVSEDTATFTVRPGELKMDQARVVGEKIKRIVNLRGNNPLNPGNPLLDPGLSTAPGGPVNLSGACIGSIPAGLHPVTEARLASIELDAASGQCQLRSDYTGTTLRLSDPPSEPPLLETWVDAYPAGAWSFVAPSPVGGKQRFLAGSVQTLRLRAPTGAVIDIQVRFTVSGANGQLDVLSTTPVQ